ncbi:hypothetical protein BYT27DRAFT_7086816 [Phlegmacium glaucopus]|nr:hypothetical protein BYT27DRAFT_7086816 [Phlegmacium glaucopus]
MTTPPATAIPITHSSFTSRFSSPIAITSAPPSKKPHSYQPDLTPSASELRPHCPAHDRLRLWKPLLSRSGHNIEGSIEVTEADLDRVITVINSSWKPSTREAYGAGLLVFHVFCNQRNIPESQRCPADPLLMLTFISSCAGSYSGKTLANYFYAIHAWHILHGAPWRMNTAEMKAALDGATLIAPPSSKRPKWIPLTVAVGILRVRLLNLTKPLDAAVYACLTTTFYSAARLGEFTVSALKAFNPVHHIKPSDVRHDQDRHGFQVTIFALPRTKTSLTGEDVYWSAQIGPSNPHAALTNHFNVNTPPADKALFSWRHPLGLRPLTRSEFLRRINAATAQLGIESLKGHGIRIGATLEYLLRGVPFDVVKSIGRWSSEAFLVYLRQHAVIIAPYIQGTPVMDAFTRYTMPPPH